MNLKSGLVMALFLAKTVFAQEIMLTDKIFEEKLTSREASSFAKLNGHTYNKKNWLNPILHNIYMANNRSETAQYRVNLENISKMTEGRLKFVDMLGSEPLDWSEVDSNKFTQSVQKFHSIAAFETTHWENANAPIMVLFSSASHNLLSAVTLDVVEDLTKKGFLVVMMEYPGYGGSMGTPGKANWEKASVGLVQFVRKIFPKRDLFLFGHSIGAPVALQTAATVPGLVQGVISHAGFYDLQEASKDSSKFIFSNQIAPLVTRIMAAKENWDSAESLLKLAQNKIPTFVIHGRDDQSVSFRHYGLITQKAKKLRETYSGFPIYAEAFDSSHEDVMANANYGVYPNIWKSITSFTTIASQKNKR